MTVYQVRLLNPAIALDRTIEVPDREYILDMAIAQGVMLPAGCRQGTCSACVVKVVSGEVDQSEQRFLRAAEIEAGYAVTCVSYALSDCTVETHQEGVLYKSSLYFSATSQDQGNGT